MTIRPLIVYGLAMLAGAATASAQAPSPTPAPPAPAVAPPPPPPASASDAVPMGALARCRDGSYVLAEPVESSCADRGGLLVRLPRREPVSAPLRAGPAPIRSIQAAPAERPANATAQCRDGSYVTTPPNGSTCGAHGGVAAILPEPRRAPPAPPAPPTATP